MPNTEKRLSWDSPHRRNAEFLASVEAGCCARDMRNAFWEHLPWLLAKREQNDMFSYREAIDAIETSQFDL